MHSFDKNMQAYIAFWSIFLDHTMFSILKGVQNGEKIIDEL